MTYFASALPETQPVHMFSRLCDQNTDMIGDARLDVYWYDLAQSEVHPE